jgi:hypothetical protein
VESADCRTRQLAHVQRLVSGCSDAMSCSFDTPIKLTIRYAERDFVRALRAHFASRVRLRFDIFLSVILAAAGAYLWALKSMHWLGVVCVVASVAMILLLFVAFVVIPPLAFRREPKFRDEYSLTFSSEGIHFRTTHIDSTLQWDLYTSALVDNHSYVLYYGWRHFTLIPKRVFQNPEQRQLFERLLAENIATIVGVGFVD